jgi:hypothetical protein
VADDEPEVTQEIEDAIEPMVWNLLAMRDDLIEGTDFYIRAVEGAEPPDRDDVVAWLERFAEHGHRSDEFRILGIPEDSGETISPQARRLHAALASSIALLLSSDEEARAVMFTVEELMERMQTPEVIGRWED